MATPKKAYYKHHEKATDADVKASAKTRELVLSTEGYKLIGKTNAGIFLEWVRNWFRDSVSYPTFAAALTDIGVTSRELIISSAVSIASNVTVPANIHIRVVKGGSFEFSSAAVMTMNGTLQSDAPDAFTGTGSVVFNTPPVAGRWRLFASGITVTFGVKLPDSVPVEWWGAVADDTNGAQTNNSVPFAAALIATAAGIKLTMPPGELGFLSGITLTDRNHLAGTRKTRLWFYGSTSGAPQTAITIDGTGPDFNGGMENFEVLQAGEVLTGTCFYLEGSVGAQNVQRIIYRDITIRRFGTGLHIESVSYINSFYNLRMVNVVIGIYAVDAVNAVNFYGCYIDCKHPTTGLPIANSYGVQWNGANNPTFYTYAFNFFGGAIENCEHALYTNQAVPFTAQFFGTYFETGDIDVQAGQITLIGCTTQHSGAHHIRIQSGTLMSLVNHRFGGSLTGVDPADALVKVLGAGSAYIEDGRTFHQSITGLTGRTNPKIYRDNAASYVRYWGIDAATGNEDGFVTEFGTIRRFRQAATDAGLVIFNKTTTSTLELTSERLKAVNALAATVGAQISNLADSQKVEVKSTGIDLTNSTGTYSVAIGVSGSSIHLALTRLVLTNIFRLANFATASRPTTDLITYSQINDSDLGLQLVYSGSGTIWRTQSRRWRILKTAVNLNNAAADVASIIGLPAKYRVIKIMAFDASINLSASAATYDLRTASGGGGSAIVAAQGVTALSAATKFQDGTIAAGFTGDYATATTLWIRNVTAHGSAATVSFLLEIEQLD